MSKTTASMAGPSCRSAPRPGRAVDGNSRPGAGPVGGRRRPQSTGSWLSSSVFVFSYVSKSITPASNCRWTFSTSSSNSWALGSFPVAGDPVERLFLVGGRGPALAAVPLGRGLLLLVPIPLEFVETRSLCRHGSPCRPGGRLLISRMTDRAVIRFERTPALPGVASMDGARPSQLLHFVVRGGHAGRVVGAGTGPLHRRRR